MPSISEIIGWFKHLSKIDYVALFLLVMVVILLYFYVNLNSELNHANQVIVSLNNDLAVNDSLRRVLSENNASLYERYVYQTNNILKLVNENSLLKRHLRSKDVEIVALTTSLQKITIENLELKGKLDSTGLGADFSYQSEYLTMDAYTRIKPEPIFKLRSLSIYDSTSVAFVEQEGLYKGYISHSNPYVINKNAEFLLNIPKETSSGVSLPVAGAIAVVVGILSAIAF